MTELSKEQSSLESLKDKALHYIDVCDSIKENKLLADDDELGELAKEELKELEPLKIELEEQIKLIPVKRVVSKN